MELDEWIFYEKRKRTNFSLKQMAEDIGVTTSTLSRIVHKHIPPQSYVAYNIEKYTNGEIIGWDMIKDFYDNEKNDNSTK